MSNGYLKSHAECATPESKEYPKTLVSDYDVRSFEQVAERGLIMKKAVVKKVHPQDNFAGVKASDFALENVVAVGALDSLKECKLGINTTSELSDAMEGSIDNAINAVNAAVASVSQNSEGE